MMAVSSAAPMSGTGDPVPCACWTEENLANAIGFAPAEACQIGTDLEFAVYGSASSVVVTFFVESTGCFYVAPDGVLAVSPLDPEVEQACRDGIQALVDEDFIAITCS